MFERAVQAYWRKGVTLPDGTPVDRDGLVKRLQQFGEFIRKPYRDFTSCAQELAVLRVLAGEDLMAVLPTGSGKSLIYQFPAWLDSGRLTLVVSPLKALIKEKARLPGEVGITSDDDPQARREVLRRLKRREAHVLHVSPEMLSHRFRSKLLSLFRKGGLTLGRIVVDEVHCASDWGHDFRADYWWVGHHLRVLEQAGAAHGRAQRILLTATADRRVMDDVMRHFPEVDGKTEVMKGLMDRPEIVLSGLRVRSDKARRKWLVRFLKRQRTRALPPGVQRRGIVYCQEAASNEVDEDAINGKGNRQLNVTDITRLLKQHGFKKTYPYSTKHLSANDREEARERFETASSRKEALTLVVATSAFGMGLDYPRVPFIVHYYPRPSLLEYAQQVGRAGRGLDCRNGEYAEALGLWRPRDWNYVRRFAGTPAHDGLLNAYTMPAHGWMYVQERGGLAMALSTPKGRRSRFSRLLAKLQDLGVVGRQRCRGACPPGWVRFALNFKALRKDSVWTELENLRDDPGVSNKRVRKVFRYFWIAAASKPGEHIVLNRDDYEADKAGTVLQRLNRWVDAGYLRFDDRGFQGDEIRLIVLRKQLTQAMLGRVRRKEKAWARQKHRMVDDVRHVLSARSPASRRRRLLEAFGDDGARHVWNIPEDLPTWLRH